jgi:hypothetical protein
VWGWHPDPYGKHEERYISGEGLPTKLVRDGGNESYDPPPEWPATPAATAATAATVRYGSPGR